MKQEKKTRGKEMIDSLAKNEEAIDAIIRMIQKISGERELVDARINCLIANHNWQHHEVRKAHLTPTAAANIAWTLGRSSQLGVLFGLLEELGRWSETEEAESKRLFEKVK